MRLTYFFRYRGLLLLALGVTVLSLGLSTEFRPGDADQWRHRWQTEAPKRVSRALEKGRAWLKAEGNASEASRPVAPRPWQIALYQGDSIVYYSHQGVPALPIKATSPNDTAFLWQKKQSAWVILQKYDAQRQRLWRLCLPLVIDYPTRNQFLQPEAPLFEDLDVRVGARPHQGYFKTSLPLPLAGTQSCNLWISPKEESLSFMALLFGAGLLISLGGALLLLYRLAEAHQWFRFVAFFALLTGLYLLLWRHWRVPATVFSSSLFSSEYYASSPFLRSFGDLLFALTGIWIVLLLWHWLGRGLRPSRGLPGGLAFGLFAIVSALAVRGTVLLLEGLVLNTNAVLDIRKLHLMDGYSALAVAAQLLLLAGLLFWHRSTLRYWSPLSSGRSEPFAWTMAATGAGLAVWAVVFWKLDRDWLGLAIWGLVWAAVAVARRKPAKEVQGVGYLVWLGLLAAIPALVLHFSLRAKERDMRRLYAYELVSDQDGLFEYLALQSVARIQADPKVQAFFKKQSPQLGALKKHLRRYYFDGYMSRYQLEVFSRPAASFPLLEWLNQRFGGSYQPVGSRNLYFLNDFTQLATYYLRLPRPDSLTASGVEEFILRFTPESQTRSSIFTELLFGRNPSKRERFPDYEYALYSEGVLSQKQGYYPYPLQLPAHQAAGEYRMYERNGYSHLLYQITPTTTAIVSLELNGLIGSLASFSALLLMLSVLSGLGYLLGRVQWRGKRPAWKALPLRMQIRMSLIGLSAISMAVVYIATATYLTNDYNESERQRLIDQLLQAEKRLSSSGPTPWSSDSAREALTRQLKDIARSLETEINFYAPNGRLLASSQPGLVEQGVLPQRMSHEAKARTRARAVSHTVVQERIGKLAFLAGYRPIAERGGRPPAYLSVPFYSKEIRLQQELTAVIVSLLNWYLLAFAGVMLVSFTLSETITRPLQLIGERLRAVDLDQGLQPIHWESQDELGRLVANYNAMIGELQKSAQKLAEKERQQAWQGMARQVAHEIKNPLTPMKLQLQQLRMAQQRDPDALLHRFPKVSDMLIRQIDQLSRIATEFSHFAKMPQGEMQWLDLRTSLGDIEQLYTNEEGARLYVEPPEAALWVWADPSHISRLLTNLVKNAFQAVADKEGVEPWVRVRAYPSGEKIYLEVADNGVGIEAGQLQWIFQPTFSTKSSGMGLGLSMCKQIVHLSGGTIEARSEPGQGTVFEVVFPRGKVSGESLPSPPQRAGEKLS